MLAARTIVGATRVCGRNLNTGAFLGSVCTIWREHGWVHRDRNGRCAKDLLWTLRLKRVLEVSRESRETLVRLPCLLVARGVAATDIPVELV